MQQNEITSCLFYYGIGTHFIYCFGLWRVSLSTLMEDFNSVGAINFINSWHRPCSHVSSWLYYSLFDNSWSLSLWFLNLMFWISHLLCKSIFHFFSLFCQMLIVHAPFEFFCWIGLYENSLPKKIFIFFFRIYISYWKSFMIINFCKFFQLCIDYKETNTKNKINILGLAQVWRKFDVIL